MCEFLGSRLCDHLKFIASWQRFHRDGATIGMALYRTRDSKLKREVDILNGAIPGHLRRFLQGILHSHSAPLASLRRVVSYLLSGGFSQSSLQAGKFDSGWICERPILIRLRSQPQRVATFQAKREGQEISIAHLCGIFRRNPLGREFVAPDS